MTLAAVGLGSNLPHRLTHLQSAVAALSELGTVTAVSSLYETAPVGGPEQGPYLNAVALVETELGAGELLAALHRIEVARGRVRTEAWGPRTLDLDLLLYGDHLISEPDLTVPHPRLTERRFALQPLVEVWPQALHPGGDLPALLSGVKDQKVETVAWRWTEGIPDFVDRGEAWVAAQTVLIVLWGAITVVTGRFEALVGVVGWMGLALVLGGLALVFWSWRTLGSAFSPLPAPAREGRLVDSGPYRLVRHPIYSGVVMLLVGAAALMGSGQGMVTALLLLLLFAAKARREESRLDLAYPGYADYRRRVRYRLLPGLW